MPLLAPSRGAGRVPGVNCHRRAAAVLKRRRMIYKSAGSRRRGAVWVKALKLHAHRVLCRPRKTNITVFNFACPAAPWGPRRSQRPRPRPRAPRAPPRAPRIVEVNGEHEARGALFIMPSGGGVLRAAQEGRHVDGVRKITQGARPAAGRRRTSRPVL